MHKGMSHHAGLTAGNLHQHKHSTNISTVLIMSDVLMDVVRWLRASGLAVDAETVSDPAEPDAVLEVTVGEQHVRFAVEVKGRTPYPHELERLQQPLRKLGSLGHPLLVAPFVSERLGTRLTENGWSWADVEGDFDLRAPGLMLRQRRVLEAPKRTRRSLPTGSGSFAIIRSLVRAPVMATALGQPRSRPWPACFSRVRRKYSATCTISDS